MKTALILFAIKLITDAFALPVVRSVTKTWIELYTRVVAESESERHELCAELLSDLHEKEAHAKESGYPPAAIALQLLVDILPEVRLALVTITLSSMASLPQKLERGSEAVRGYRMPQLAVISLATFLMINSVGLLAETEDRLVDLLMKNLGLIIVVILFWQKERRWARIALIAIPVSAFVGLLAFYALFTVEYRAFEHPLFIATILDGGIVLLPLVLIAALTTEYCRVRVLRGSLWHLGLCIVGSAAVSYIVASAFAQNSNAIVEAWIVISGAMAALLGLVFLYTYSTVKLCSAALWTGAISMKVLAAGIRRLH